MILVLNQMVVTQRCSYELLLLIKYLHFYNVFNLKSKRALKKENRSMIQNTHPCIKIIKSCLYRPIIYEKRKIMQIGGIEPGYKKTLLGMR